MFESVSELLKKINLGEDHFLELKEVRFAGKAIKGPDRKDLADELAAFANQITWIACFSNVAKARTERSRIMEKRGEGVPLILERSERLSGKRPTYTMLDDSELLLVIPAAENVA